MSLEILDHGKSKFLEYTYFGTSPWFGVELEVDVLKHQDREMLQNTIARILDRANTKDHYILEKDGSLKNGLEIIFQPHSEEELINFIKTDFKYCLNDLQNFTTLEEASPLAGLHIHVSREAFGKTKLIQNENIAKLIFLTSKFKTNFYKIGQKRNLAYAKFPSRKLSIPDAIQKVIDESSTYVKENRYQAINVVNSNTVEFRFFRSTLELDRLLFCIDFIIYLVKQSNICTWSDCTDWNIFFKDAPNHLKLKIDKLL